MCDTICHCYLAQSDNNNNLCYILFYELFLSLLLSLYFSYCYDYSWYVVTSTAATK